MSESAVASLGYTKRQVAIRSERLQRLRNPASKFGY